MKKYIIALLLGVGLMAMQAASAATLTLTNPIGVTGTVDNGTSSTGSVVGGGFVTVNITAASGELVNLLFSFTEGAGSFGLLGGVDPTGLGAGTYGLAVIGTGNINVSIEPVGEVPVPAAVWLFGSALLGLFGVNRRKSSPALAA